LLLLQTGYRECPSAFATLCFLSEGLSFPPDIPQTFRSALPVFSWYFLRQKLLTVFPDLQQAFQGLALIFRLSFVRNIFWSAPKAVPGFVVGSCSAYLSVPAFQ